MSPDTTEKHRIKPKILGDEDKPFSESDARTIELESLRHKHQSEDFKNKTGRMLMLACLLIIVLFSIADAIFQISAPLFSGTFELLKVVAMTVLGFLFGSRERGA